MKAGTATHPAPYSPEVLSLFAKLIPAGARIHDPFAGSGERLGALADEHGWVFTGTELEAPFIGDGRVVEGDATDRSTYPLRWAENERGRVVGWTVVTSPVYPNGIADDFHAQDSSTRRTYRSALAKITGEDRPLHPNNQGRWGYRGSSLSSPARAVYWKLANDAVACWGLAERVLLNVSDFMVGKRVEPVVDGWARTLQFHGWTIVKAYPVLTRRYRNGANRDARVANEVVLEARQ